MLTRIESCMFENKSFHGIAGFEPATRITLLCQIKLYSEVYRRHFESSAVFEGGLDLLDAKSKKNKDGCAVTLKENTDLHIHSLEDGCFKAYFPVILFIDNKIFYRLKEIICDIFFSCGIFNY